MTSTPKLLNILLDKGTDMEDLQTAVKTDVNTTVFVDRFDDGVWLSLQAQRGSANCVLTKDQARALIAALTKVVEA
jgi:hypothetical protein